GLVSATPSQGTYDAQSGTWTVGNLALDASASLTLVATVQAAGPLMNSARTTAQTEADPNPANDEASVSLNARTTADVALSKTLSNPVPAVDAAVRFTVTATN